MYKMEFIYTVKYTQTDFINMSLYHDSKLWVIKCLLPMGHNQNIFQKKNNNFTLYIRSTIHLYFLIVLVHSVLIGLPNL